MMPELRSSNLASAEYDEATRELTITFKSGASYAYSGVDRTTYDDLLTASSPGRYFAEYIKGKHPDRRL
jgi:hypothetical protein